MRGFDVRRPGGWALLTALAYGLAGCGGGDDAAAQISAFLSSARADDRMVFEAHIDRASVRQDLRAQFASLPGVQDLQAQIGEGISDGALDRMISPGAIRRLEASAGVAGEAAADVKPKLRRSDQGRLCLPDAEAVDVCLMTFEKIDETWKLVGLHAHPQSFTPPGTDVDDARDASSED